jgi:hypothetical protein
MVTFQREMLFEVAGEVDDLLQCHYQELTLNKDRVKLKPMWAEYRILEELGRFVVFTARDGDNLVGYSAFFVQQHLHYADLKTAINDVLYLHPDYRQGRTGIRLLQHCEAALKADGVDKLCWHAKLDTALIPILHRLDYKTEEISLGKML